MQAPLSPALADTTALDDTTVAALRQQLPVLQRQVYLNSGTAGPIPLLSAEAIAQEATRELHEGRAHLAGWGRFFSLMGQCRELAAQLLGADLDEIALTHHSSEGINIALWGLELQPGDRILTSTLEHDAVAIPLGVLRERRGVELSWVDIGRGERTLEAFAQALATTPAKLLVVSHVSYSTGAELPIAELAALAHRHGARILVDGAQTCGARPLDVHALEADFYTLSGQKWLCGPEGTGALYVARECLDQLTTTFASYFSAQRHDYRGNVRLHASARRFETGMVYRPAWAGFAASATWLLQEVGLARAWSRALALRHQAASALERLPGIELISPASCPSQLLSFDLPHYTPAQLWALTHHLAQTHQLVIRSLPHPPYALRASFGWFNSQTDLEKLVDAIHVALELDPQRLPIEGYGASLPRTR